MSSQLRIRLLTFKHYLHQNLLAFLARPDAGRYLKVGGGILAALLLFLTWYIAMWIISIISFHRFVCTINILIFKQANVFTIYESHDSMLIRINLYLGFKDSMKLIDDKDARSRLSLFYNFIGISNKICIRYNIKVLNFYTITNTNLI